MEGSRGRNMSSPFAQPTIHLRSMTRYGITAWAHDLINELQKLGILDPANTDALNDLVGVYRNLEQFFIWVFQRPRTVPAQPHGPLQPLMDLRDLFLTLHRIWDDLEWDLRPEKDGAFIDQMIDNLGWLWDLRSKLKNRIRRLPMMSSVDALVEAANYAQLSDISHRNIIQSSTAAPLSSAGQPLPPVAPARKSSPRNLGDWASGSRKGGEQTRENIMSQTRESSFPTSFTQNAKTGHLQLPKYSQLSQKNAQSAMRRALSSYNSRLAKPSFAVQHPLPFPLEQAPRNLLGLANNDHYFVPTDSTFFISRTRDGIKPEIGLFNNNPKKKACGSTNKDAILITESPPPERDNAQYLSSRTQSNHLTAAVPRGDTESPGPAWQSSSPANSWTPINGNNKQTQARLAEERKAKEESMHQRLSRQKQQSVPNKRTNLGPIEKAVGVNPVPAKAKTAKDIHRPYSTRDNIKKEGPGNK
ncbi:hypothetical protein DSL72_004307 [Monilinia vaccinii-corymbosi]|uniref:Uncharacterized protein n=1 Tax=Monilinia vaccinii-corymbosi TaxID=61207 RepID=A0A8A3P056_9HELO|nr:hypothetical protein DSL72_004307 [Monilinia vaccinii-corymbosi]